MYPAQCRPPAPPGPSEALPGTYPTPAQHPPGSPESGLPHFSQSVSSVQFSQSSPVIPRGQEGRGWAGGSIYGLEDRGPGQRRGASASTRDGVDSASASTARRCGVRRRGHICTPAASTSWEIASTCVGVDTRRQRWRVGTTARRQGLRRRASASTRVDGQGASVRRASTGVVRRYASASTARRYDTASTAERRRRVVAKANVTPT